jgi:hypothetical protein
MVEPPGLTWFRITVRVASLFTVLVLQRIDYRLRLLASFLAVYPALV